MSKVIKIIDPYHIIVSRDGLESITSKDILQVYTSLFNICYEGVDYGVFDFIKAELRVKAIYPKMILCENNNFTKTKIPIQTIDSNLKEPFFEKNSEEKHYKEVENVVPLLIDPSEVDQEMNIHSIRLIKLGDSVRAKPKA